MMDSCKWLISVGRVGGRSGCDLSMARRQRVVWSELLSVEEFNEVWRVLLC